MQCSRARDGKLFARHVAAVEAFTPGLASELDAIGIVDDSIEDHVCDCRFADR